MFSFFFFFYLLFFILLLLLSVSRLQIHTIVSNLSFIRSYSFFFFSSLCVSWLLCAFFCAFLCSRYPMFAKFNSLVKWNVLFTLNDIRFTMNCHTHTKTHALSPSRLLHNKNFSFIFIFMFGCISANSERRIKKRVAVTHTAHLERTNNNDNNETFIDTKRKEKMQANALTENSRVEFFLFALCCCFTFLRMSACSFIYILFLFCILS